MFNLFKPLIYYFRLLTLNVERAMSSKYPEALIFVGSFLAIRSGTRSVGGITRRIDYQQRKFKVG